MTFNIERSELERAGVQSQAELWNYIRRRAGAGVQRAYIFTGKNTLLVIVRGD